MAKFKYMFGGEEADWDENLYHVTLPVRNGMCEADDELTIDALLRRGWELVETEAQAPAVAESASPSVSAAASPVGKSPTRKSAKVSES